MVILTETCFYVTIYGLSFYQLKNVFVNKKRIFPAEFRCEDYQHMTITSNSLNFHGKVGLHHSLKKKHNHSACICVCEREKERGIEKLMHFLGRDDIYKNNLFI